MKKKLQFKISSNGQIKAIYSDDLVSLISQGEAQTVRASHVEPCGNGWSADLSPVNGPVLGPFKTRQEALDAEVSYLEVNVLKL